MPLPSPNERGTVRFVENRGQIRDTRGDARPDILYTAGSGGVKLYFRPNGVSYVFTRLDNVTPPDPAQRFRADMAQPVIDTAGRVTLYRIDLELIGANRTPEVVAEGATGELLNYYLAHCPEGITGVRSFARITYREIYPNIDLTFYGTEGGMKYDFVVRPGGRVSDIRMRYVGSDGVKKASGGLRVETPLGRVEEGIPYSYEQSTWGDREIRSGYRLTNGEIGFDVGRRDSTRVLVIDPKLQWSTYFGGSGNDGGWFGGWGGGGWGGWGGTSSILTDSSGNIIIVGATASNDFPASTGAFQTTLSAGEDTFVAKIDRDGSSRIWATYYGGTSFDYAVGIAMDSTGNLAFTGGTQSIDFPVSAGAFQTTRAGVPATPIDAVIVKLNSNGTRQWGTYYGGSNFDYGGGIAFDTSGNILIGGSTASGGMGTAGVFQPSITGFNDFFVAKFSPAGSRLWMTYFGGSSYEYYSSALAVDHAGNIYLSGSTQSTNFPASPSAFQTSLNTGFNMDGCLVKLDKDGGRVWATYVGGTQQESSTGLVLDRSGNIVIGGYTYSTDFPVTTGAYRTTAPGQGDSYIMKFTSAGARVWGTYFGGSAYDWPGGFAIDDQNSVIFNGSTLSTNLPVTPDAYQSTSSLGGVSDYDGFVAVLDSNGSSRRWVTYLGGISSDWGAGICFDRGAIITMGWTWSNDYPTTVGAYKTTLGGLVDLSLTKFCDLQPRLRVDGPRRFCSGDSTVLRGPDAYTNYRWSNGATTKDIVVRQPGLYWVVADQGGCTGITDTVTIVVDSRPAPEIVLRGSLAFCEGDSALLETRIPYHRYQWSNGATTRGIVIKQSGTYWLRAYDSTTGCWGSSTDSVRITVHPNPQPAIRASGPLSFCDGDSVTLDGGEGFTTYEWSSGERTRQITVRKSGLYGLKVTNAHGCIGLAAAVNVRVFPIPKVKITAMSPTVVCSGDSVVLAATLGFVQYRWNNGATTQTIVLKESGSYRVTVTDTNGCTAESDPIRIEILSPPRVAIRALGSTKLCDGDSVVLDADAGHQRYTWSNGATGQQIVVRKAGRYSVRVRDAFGCEGESDTIEVTVDPRPRASLSGPRGVCANATAVYTVAEQEHVQYRWTVNGGGGTIIGRSDTSSVTVQWGASGSGLIRVRLTDTRTGCAVDTQLRVEVGVALEPTISTSRSTTLCRGDSVELDAGGGYATYLWSTGAATRRIVVRDAGVYSVSVTDASGCSGRSGNVEVKINPDPQPVIAVPPNQRLCEGDTMELDAGSGYTSYLWTTGETTRRIKVWRAGTYSVEVVDSIGCRGRSTEAEVTIVPRPTASVDGPNSVCLNATARYRAPATAGIEYRWRVSPGGAIIGGAVGGEISVQWSSVGDDTLTLTAIDTANGCSDRTLYIVRVGTELHPRINPGGWLALCIGDSIELAAPSGYDSYRWSTGETTQRIIVRGSGSYWVEVTAGECRGRSDTAHVYDVRPSTVVITPGPSIEICAGDSVELDAGKDFLSYRWSTGETTRRIRVRGAGRYSVSVTDTLGCDVASSEVEVIEHAVPAVSIAQRGDTLEASDGGVSYRWFRDGAQVAGASTRRLIVGQAGTYAVAMTDHHGCTGVATIDELTRARSVIVIAPTETEAVPGEHITLRLELAESSGLEQTGARRYRAKLRFDRDLLLPRGRTPLGVVRGNDRVVTIDGERAKGQERGELATVELIAALGDTLATAVVIEEFMWDARGVAVETRDGMVRIRPEGSWRAYMGHSQNSIEIIGSNPSNGSMVIWYEVVEQSMMSLSVIDVLGRSVSTLAEGERAAGRYMVEYDASGLAGGVYFVVLETPSSRVIERLTVIE